MPTHPLQSERLVFVYSGLVCVHPKLSLDVKVVVHGWIGPPWGTGTLFIAEAAQAVTVVVPATVEVVGQTMSQWGPTAVVRAQPWQLMLVVAVCAVTGGQ